MAKVDMNYRLELRALEGCDETPVSVKVGCDAGGEPLTLRVQFREMDLGDTKRDMLDQIKHLEEAFMALDKLRNANLREIDQLRAHNRMLDQALKDMASLVNERNDLIRALSRALSKASL
jgi:hypothetical protein